MKKYLLTSVLLSLGMSLLVASSAAGGDSTWAWDRKPLTLNKGRNTIRLTPAGTVLTDHLNILPGF